MVHTTVRLLKILSFNPKQMFQVGIIIHIQLKIKKTEAQSVKVILSKLTYLVEMALQFISFLCQGSNSLHVLMLPRKPLSESLSDTMSSVILGG